ncbi:MAG: hypothetical protein LCH61_07310 [Proteobacteria bacterium]|nr:hypothetical protein [Pseudomonadota bacterium]
MARASGLHFLPGDTFRLDELWRENSAQIRLDTQKDRSQFYLGSYSFILAHFADCTFDGSDGDAQRFWQGLILVYSWMGRGLLTDFSDPIRRYQAQCTALQRARAGIEPTLDGLEPLIALCNRSTIATSKVLHFINPVHFAIWDSRVAHAATGGRAYPQWTARADNFLDYLECLRRSPVSAETIAEVRALLQESAERRARPAPISDLRVKEFILFMAGAKAPSDAQ